MPTTVPHGRMTPPRRRYRPQVTVTVHLGGADKFFTTGVGADGMPA